MLYLYLNVIHRLSCNVAIDMTSTYLCGLFCLIDNEINITFQQCVHLCSISSNSFNRVVELLLQLGDETQLFWG